MSSKSPSDLCELSDGQRDELWWALLRIADKYCRRSGKMASVRFDRHACFLITNLCELADILRKENAIPRWEAGERKLDAYKTEVLAKFKEKHGKLHNDP